MYLLLNLTSNKMDTIYLLIYSSGSHLFPAKVSVPIQREKKNPQYLRAMVLTCAKGAEMS